MNLSNEYETIKQALVASSAFHLIKANEQRFVATSLSGTPKRGIFRLVIPQVQVVITIGMRQSPIISIRPDPLTIFMLIMLLGGVSSEFFMDRSLYPREYPPEFIYGWAILYIGLLIIKIFNAQKQIHKLLNQPRP
jgi:hypothetical protein